MRSLFAGIAAMGTACALSANAAELNSHAPNWHCWYGDHAAHVTCFQPHLPAGRSPTADETEDLTRDLADALIAQGNYAALTRVIRKFPESFRGVTQLVPLHAIPFDIESVQQLTAAVMCPRRTCSVFFDTNGVPHALIRARKSVAVY